MHLENQIVAKGSMEVMFRFSALKVSSWSLYLMSQSAMSMSYSMSSGVALD